MPRPAPLSSTSSALLAGASLVGALLACTPAPAKPGEGQAGAKAAQAAPTPEALCQHLREVAAKDTQDAQALDTVQRECVQTLTGVEARYRTLATCLELAGTADAVAQCEEALAKPAPLLGAASPTAKLEMLCDHVLKLISAELGAMAGMGADEMAKLRERCITDAGAQIETLGPEGFNKQADCLLGAQDLAGLEKCGGFQR